MPFITSLVLAAFVAYAGAWFSGAVEGNFAFLLFMASAVTGVYWLAERFYFLPAREAAVRRLQEADEQRRAGLQKQGISRVDGDVAKAADDILASPGG